MIDVHAVREALQSPQSEVRINRMWREIEHQRHPLPSYAPKQWIGWAISCCALGTIVALIWWNHPTGPLTDKSGDPLANRVVAHQTMASVFADDSQMRLQRGSVLELLANTSTEVGFALRHGRVDFNVTPHGPRKWIIDSGPVKVEVVGTIFTVVHKPSHVDVAVRRGAVVVRSELMPDRVRRVTAGQRVRVSLKTSAEQTNRETERSPATKRHQKRIKKPGLKAKGIKSYSESNSWKTHVERGNYEDAYNSLGASRLRRMASHSDKPPELFALADIARLGGYPQEAELPLLTIVNDHSSDPKAGLAAYTLAKLYLEQLANGKKSATMFKRALKLGIPQAMEESAIAKQVEAYATFNHTRAAEAAQVYMVQYPSGRYLHRIKPYATTP